jgi:uncharacterized protein YndB with AHSA1/START domain
VSGFPQRASVSVDIAAPVEVVWDLIADVTRMGAWSPECVRAEWLDSTSGPAVGSRFRGHNQLGTFEWDVTCTVTEYERPRVFAFDAPWETAAPSHWRFEIAPHEFGATLTESFDAPLINVEGSIANFDGRFEALVEGVRSTLANIKNGAEHAVDDAT